jgi:uncharacterized protein YbjT (DUF2867 family)
MRTLVTGGTGLLGRAVVALVQDEGHEVRLLARRPGTSTDVEWHGDLGTVEGAVTAVAGVETVIHAATNSPAARRGGVLEAANTSAAGRRGTTRWAEWLRRSDAALPLSRAA